MPKSPRYKKIVINGEITNVDKIPIGTIVPKSFTQIGIVAICAPIDADNELTANGTIRCENSFFIVGEKIMIPANAQ